MDFSPSLVSDLYLMSAASSLWISENQTCWLSYCNQNMSTGTFLPISHFSPLITRATNLQWDFSGALGAAGTQVETFCCEASISKTLCVVEGQERHCHKWPHYLCQQMNPQMGIIERVGTELSRWNRRAPRWWHPFPIILAPNHTKSTILTWVGSGRPTGLCFLPKLGSGCSSLAHSKLQAA